jgi:hypothetical protein
MTSPEQWCVITERGQRARESRFLDDLDEALARIDPSLVEMRDGAWSALHSGTPDSIRQAAHSARELIEHTRGGAPDDEVGRQPWYTPDASSRSGISRRQRLRYLVQVRSGRSANDTLVAEAACDLVLRLTKDLLASAHGTPPSRSDAEDVLSTLELALRRILISRST